MEPNETRREFLHLTAAAGAAAGLASLAQAQGPAQGQGQNQGQEASRTGVPTRPLGRTGVNVSILALGGWHVGSIREDAEAIRVMHTALDEGITFFDNAWDYHDGRSEELMGRALAQDNRRRRVFLMTKNCARDAAGTRQHLEDSLRRLRTEVIDLWQFHEINYDNDPDWIFDRGAMRAALDAQREGKIRFIGFTGHKSPEIHLAMLARHQWDAVQMPVNVCDVHYRSFIRRVIPECVRREIGVIGMKSFGGGANGQSRFAAGNVCTAEEARNFALSQQIASLVVGIDSMDILRQDLAMVRRFPALNANQLTQLSDRVRAQASDGRHERFKSTQAFDGPYHQRQHGFTE